MKLEEALLDVEVFVNNRPLCYIGEDFEVPVIAPNICYIDKPRVFWRRILTNWMQIAIHEDVTRECSKTVGQRIPPRIARTIRCNRLQKKAK